MKVFRTVMKIVAALAVVAGIVYIVATYGDKIVAWARNLLGKAKSLCSCDGDCCCGDDCCCDDDCCCEEAPVEETPVEEAPAEETDFEN